MTRRCCWNAKQDVLPNRRVSANRSH